MKARLREYEEFVTFTPQRPGIGSVPAIQMRSAYEIVAYTNWRDGNSFHRHHQQSTQRLLLSVRCGYGYVPDAAFGKSGNCGGLSGSFGQ